MAHNAKNRIKAVDRTADIVEVLREDGPLTSREIADVLDVGKSTVHVYLSTLEDREFVVQTDQGYSLSLKFLEYGTIKRDDLQIIQAAEDSLTQLAHDTSEAVYLVVEEHGRAVYVDYALGDRAVRTHGRIGTRSPLHSLASGKAILANLPQERVDEIVEKHGLTKHTKNTIQSIDALYEELATIREQGYAVNNQEAHEGTRAVAAPIVVHNEVVGAITVVGPANRITLDRIEDDVLREVLATANEIELKLS